MVDLHSHILAGVDDGARSLEESLEMVRMAAASGTTDLVATPHANNQFPFDAERIQRSFHQLSQQTAGLIHLHLGCDLHLSFDNLRDVLANPVKYTINGSQYLLVELPDLIALPSTREALRHLVQAGISPIITHPERNLSLQTNSQELKAWVADGCLIQVTGQSLLGSFGGAAKRAAHSFLGAHLVHFVASDAHDTSRRPPDLTLASKHIESRYGPETAHRLFVENPAMVIRGGQIVAPKPKLSFSARFLSFSRHSKS